ncbi:MAG: hypothetical protein CMI68_04945 [Candidatus Pelagibacter sp.]|jgi:predicted site-specific integrase-resolvase|nr:hypothetical protein [Candidatus Pelagibacter sp.]|tara:strand:- start:6501 stop:6686 length:186 start_codon:yes stop_codon:yes gene_type:complete
MNRKFLTSKEVSEQLNISEKTLSNHRSLGTGLPFFKFEGIIRYPKDNVEKFINSKMHGSKN